MTLQVVRSTLTTWLNGGDVPGLNTVWQAMPARIDFSAFGTGPHRCQGVLFISAEGERRIALGGPTGGKKRIDYRVELDLYHHSVARDPIDARLDFDDVIEGLKTQIRASRTFNDDTGTLLQVGEGVYGIQSRYERPRKVGSEATETEASVSFECTAIITS